MGLQEVPSLLGAAPPEHLVHVNSLRDAVVQVAEPEDDIVVQDADPPLYPPTAELARKIAELPESTNGQGKRFVLFWVRRRQGE